MLWCQPTETYWDLTISNMQCTSYHGHTALTISFDIPNTLLVMILPVPFIPTPRRLLLAILLVLSTLVLITGTLSRASVLANPWQATYLHWYTTESTLSIIFANLPFLTSLIVTAAPARIRHFSSQLALSQWPRSRRGSWEIGAPISPLRSSRFNNMETTTTEITSPTATEKAQDWNIGTLEVRQGGNRTQRDSGASSQPSTRESDPTLPSPFVMRPKKRNSRVSKIETRGLRGSAAGSQHSRRETSPVLRSPVAIRTETRDSQVPKMRLSGGLAEMGELGLQDTTQEWPIYWR